MNQILESLSIDEDDLKEILTVVGYPLIDIEDLEYSLEDIKRYFLFPAMREYYKWFPLEESQSIAVSGEFEIPFPDEYTFAVVDARLVSQPMGSTKIANPFYNELIYHKSTSRGYYGTNNNYGMTESRIIKKLERQSIINSSKSFRINVDKHNRILKGYSTLTGQMSVIWAKFSANYSDVPFMYTEDIKKLAQANLLEGLVMIRGQQNSNLDIEFNYQLFEDKAETLREEVMTKFREHSKVVLIRG